MRPAQGIKNPFIRDWKRNFFADAGKRIASIPFLRNLIEYTRGESDQEFLKLTSLLHWKMNSAAIKQKELDGIYHRLFGGNGNYVDSEESVVEMILATARSYLEEAPRLDAAFERKIVLSIAIRIAAERFMVERIDDEVFMEDLGANQSPKLLRRFKDDFPAETGAVDVIQRVLLMTPENIHLNSFMYEPIVDMSDDHLRRLMSRVIAL